MPITIKGAERTGYDGNAHMTAEGITRPARGWKEGQSPYEVAQRNRIRAIFGPIAGSWAVFGIGAVAKSSELGVGGAMLGLATIANAGRVIAKANRLDRARDSQDATTAALREVPVPESGEGTALAAASRVREAGRFLASQHSSTGSGSFPNGESYSRASQLPDRAMLEGASFDLPEVTHTTVTVVGVDGEGVKATLDLGTGEIVWPPEYSTVPQEDAGPLAIA